MRRLPPTLLTLACLAFVAGCGGDKDSGAQTGTGAGTQAQQTQPQTAAPSQGGCTQVDAPQAKPDGDLKKPKGALEAGKTYQLVVTTNCGAFTIELDPDAAPEASSSLVSLARKGFFEDTVFHRIVPGFVIQGGDPTGSGQGGPGYSTRDKPPEDTRYEKGSVAMAKTGDEPAGTGGSQFFVVTGDEVGLPPEYALVGEVSKGLETVERIGRLGDPSTEMPTQPVVVERVTVKTSSGSS